MKDLKETGFLAAIRIRMDLRPTGGWPVNNNDERDYEEEEANRRLIEEHDDDGDDDEDPADGESFDGGFGHGSYFHRAMQKDD